MAPSLHSARPSSRVPSLVEQPRLRPGRRLPRLPRALAPFDDGRGARRHHREDRWKDSDSSSSSMRSYRDVARTPPLLLRRRRLATGGSRPAPARTRIDLPGPSLGGPPRGGGGDARSER
ncbi:hypothetical protein ZWY2020_003352 [Hordeum vulgare]|nr:hypothetical protein ZWY2020_003352 [Hordeum vulgare]